MEASSFEYMPGLPIFHSRNLTDWRQIGHALNRCSQIDLSVRKSSEGIYAPTLRYHQFTVRSRLHFQPQQAGEEDGLTVRLNERGHFTLGIRRAGEDDMLTVVVSVTATPAYFEYFTYDGMD